MKIKTTRLYPAFPIVNYANSRVNHSTLQAFYFFNEIVA